MSHYPNAKSTHLAVGLSTFIKKRQTLASTGFESARHRFQNQKEGHTKSLANSLTGDIDYDGNLEHIKIKNNEEDMYVKT